MLNIRCKDRRINIWTIGRTKVIHIIGNVRTMKCIAIQSHFGNIDYTVVANAIVLQVCVNDGDQFPTFSVR